MVLAVPFAFRAIDNGLAAVPLRTLVEAARNLGAGRATTLVRVVLPTIRTAVLGAAFLTLALVLGEVVIARILLYTDTFDGFCLVSSDSDFTRLAARLRESGKLVVGFGERKTPRAFVTACDQFVYTEVFKKSAGEPTEAAAKVAQPELRADTRLVRLLRGAISTASGEDGLASLSAIGNLLLKHQPDFDPRLYGYTKLSDLVEAVGLFTVDRQKGGAVYVSDQRPTGS